MPKLIPQSKRYQQKKQELHTLPYTMVERLETLSLEAQELCYTIIDGCSVDRISYDTKQLRALLKEIEAIKLDYYGEEQSND